MSHLFFMCGPKPLVHFLLNKHVYVMVSQGNLHSDLQYTRLKGVGVSLGVCSSDPEAGSGAEAWLSDMDRPYLQVVDHLHGPEHGVKLLSELLVVRVEV